jgi:hypothetical protein
LPSLWPIRANVSSIAARAGAYPGERATVLNDSLSGPSPTTGSKRSLTVQLYRRGVRVLAVIDGELQPTHRAAGLQLVVVGQALLLCDTAARTLGVHLGLPPRCRAPGSDRCIHPDRLILEET